MKQIKSIIIIVLILIIITIISIIVLNLNKDESKVQDADEYEISDEEQKIEISNEIEEVDEISKFYIVESCIQEYYNKINNNSSDYYEVDYEKNRIPIVSQEEINKIKLNLLSKEYIESNNINISNINNNIVNIEEQVTVVALQMKVLINDPIEKYVVYGFIANADYEILYTFYTFVNLDTQEKTFSIEPITEQYENIEKINFENNNEKIEFNESNEYEEKILNYEEISKKYFSRYKIMALASPKFLYNNFLDTDYKEKRFGSKEAFENYVFKNREEIEQTLFRQYQVNDLENGTQYVCKDQYENLYIFNETLPMQFTLQLDTYTITTDKFKEEYNKSDNQNKVMMNVDKWIQMLNNRDYEAAYNVLDGTFRNNNFGSQERFEEYMRQNYSEHYKVEFVDFSEEANTFVQNIILTDIMDETVEQKQLNIIMQLKEGTDFVMSFEI